MDQATQPHEGERRRRVLAVRPDAAPCQGPPETQGGGRLVALHPPRGPVTRHPVLEAENQSCGLVESEQFVVSAVRQERTRHDRRLGEAAHNPPGQVHRLLGHRRATLLVEDPRDERHACGVQGDLLLQYGTGLQRQQSGTQLAQGAPDLDARVGRGRGQHGGAGQAHRHPFDRTAVLAAAAVRPEAAVGDTERLDHGDVETAALETQSVGERLEPLHHLTARLPLPRLLAEVDDHARGTGAPAFAALHETLRQLLGDGLPVVRVRGNAEPRPAAEPASSAAVVQGDQDDAVLRSVPEQVGQGVGQLGRSPQGDLVVGGACAVPDVSLEHRVAGDRPGAHVRPAR